MCLRQTDRPQRHKAGRSNDRVRRSHRRSKCNAQRCFPRADRRWRRRPTRRSKMPNPRVIASPEPAPKCVARGRATPARSPARGRPDHSRRCEKSGRLRVDPAPADPAVAAPAAHNRQREQRRHRLGSADPTRRQTAAHSEPAAFVGSAGNGPARSNRREPANRRHPRRPWAPQFGRNAYRRRELAPAARRLRHDARCGPRRAEFAELRKKRQSRSISAVQAADPGKPAPPPQDTAGLRHRRWARAALRRPNLPPEQSGPAAAAVPARTNRSRKDPGDVPRTQQHRVGRAGRPSRQVGSAEVRRIELAPGDLGIAIDAPTRRTISYILSGRRPSKCLGGERRKRQHRDADPAEDKAAEEFSAIEGASGRVCHAEARPMPRIACGFENLQARRFNALLASDSGKSPAQRVTSV